MFTNINNKAVKQQNVNIKKDNDNNIVLAQKTYISLKANDYNATTSITTATVYESGNKTIATNCLSNTFESPNQKDNKATLKKQFSIYDQPHRKRYNSTNNNNNNNNFNFNSTIYNDGNNKSKENEIKNSTKKIKHKKRYNHFIPVNLEDIITDVKEKTINAVKNGKAKNNSYNKKNTGDEMNDDSNSNSNSLSSTPPLISSITPTSSSPTTFTTTSTVTTSIIKKGKNRVHHHLLYSKEHHPDSFYEENNRENDYYPLGSRSSSFYDTDNIAENGFQTPNSSPTNSLKK